MLGTCGARLYVICSLFKPSIVLYAVGYINSIAIRADSMARPCKFSLYEKLSA